jgi:hypothetical protein
MNIEMEDHSVTLFRRMVACIEIIKAEGGIETRKKMRELFEFNDLATEYVAWLTAIEPERFTMAQQKIEAIDQIHKGLR